MHGSAYCVVWAVKLLCLIGSEELKIYSKMIPRGDKPIIKEVEGHFDKL